MTRFPRLLKSHQPRTDLLHHTEPRPNTPQPVRYPAASPPPPLPAHHRHLTAGPLFKPPMSDGPRATGWFPPPSPPNPQTPTDKTVVDSRTGAADSGDSFHAGPATRRILSSHS